MKIAICLYGKFTGRNDRNEIQGFDLPLKFLQENVLNDKTDVFLHGWDDNEIETSRMIESVKPKRYVVEKQITFDHPYKHYNFVPDGPWSTQIGLRNNYSKFHSLRSCIDLVDDSYDLVMITRYDCIFYEKFNFELLDPKNFYVSHWNLNHEGWGFNDVWFVSGLENMRLFLRINERLNDYFDVEKGEYIKFLKSKGLDVTNISSGHPIWRYRLKEIGLDQQIFCYGLEYESYGLLRRFGLRQNPWGKPNVDITIPSKYSY